MTFSKKEAETIKKSRYPAEKSRGSLGAKSRARNNILPESPYNISERRNKMPLWGRQRIAEAQQIVNISCRDLSRVKERVN